MTKQQRQELNALSKQVFGSASRWQDIVSKGHIMPKLDAKGEIIPNQFVRVQPTAESAAEFMRAALAAIQKGLENASE